MGLDIVELVMEIEEAFDVKISDARAEKLVTVGDIYEFLLEEKRLLISNEGVCLSAATFYMVRRAACEELGLDAKSIRPDTRLETSIPVSQRRTAWRRIQRAMGLRVPGLRRPEWLVLLASLIVFGCALISFLLNARGWGWALAGGAAMASLFTLGRLAARITRPFQTKLPKETATFGELARSVSHHNFAKLNEKFNSLTHEAIWKALTGIIAEQAGISVDEIRPESRIVADLGF